ncbi:nucleolar protein 16-like [Eriocheir sinensis]|uniref:nucleolar protein 16-like n=1 Tax=Eriocheir sinensis TaxID=95602 RepID=UPI0021CA1C07|nr:nucleolar protein 16-like [Eriocheir sinensis]XP_050714250.1 nucleolar protein 16-like [Eriocheir sinensis]XP_050714251.1 nucleolar protein 16-like [Eriocheir sinensis]
MGVRSRKKSRNKSRYRIASKRRKASAKRKINPNIECSAVRAEWDKRKPASTNVSNMGLVYNLSKIGLSGIKSTREALLGGRSKTGGKPTTAVKQLEEEVCSKAQSEKPGIRLTNAQVEYATAMLDKYGDDYKAMTRDPTNYFQDTSKQIERKIKLFTDNPRYFVPYLRKKGMLKS